MNAAGELSLAGPSRDGGRCFASATRRPDACRTRRPTPVSASRSTSTARRPWSSTSTSTSAAVRGVRPPREEGLVGALNRQATKSGCRTGTPAFTGGVQETARLRPPAVYARDDRPRCRKAPKSPSASSGTSAERRPASSPTTTIASSPTCAGSTASSRTRSHTAPATAPVRRTGGRRGSSTSPLASSGWAGRRAVGWSSSSLVYRPCVEQAGGRRRDVHAVTANDSKWQEHPYATKAIGDLMYTFGLTRVHLPPARPISRP